MNLVPQPHQVRKGKGNLAIDRLEGIACDDLFSPGAYRTACFLRDELCARLGVELKVGSARDFKGKTITVGLLSDPGVKKALAGPLRTNAAKALGPEGYALRIASGKACIGGWDPRGTYYGAQTFLQLCDAENGKPSAPAASVVDMPEHPFRGAHLYLPPRTEIPYLKRLISHLASVKMNTVIFELAGALEFRRHPEVNRSWQDFCETVRHHPLGPAGVELGEPLHGRGNDSSHSEQGGRSWISQEDMREILRHARANHVEVFPEVQSLSHSYWLCLPHPEIAEWKEAKWPATYCPCNPRAYELLFDCMEEVLEVFESEWVSIGHDEWYFPGVCPECRKKDLGKLLAADINRLRDWLSGRGVKTLMWGDQLINPDECACKRRPEYGTGKMIRYAGGERTMESEAGKFVMRKRAHAIRHIPHDVAIADWYFSLTPDTETYFRKYGKEVIFGNFNPDFFDTCRQRLFAGNVRGGLFSTWIEMSERGQAARNWACKALAPADMLWSSAYRKGSLKARRDAFRDYWNRNRQRLHAPALSPLTHRPGAWRAKTLCLPKQDLPAGIRGKLPDLRVAKKDLPLSCDLRGGPLVLAEKDAEVVVPVGGKVKALWVLEAFSPLGEEMESLPALYSYNDYKEFFLAQEVGRYGVRMRATPRSVYHPVREGDLPQRLGMEVDYLENEKLAPATYTDGIALGRGRMLYAWEWVNPNPETMTVESLVLRRGRSPLGGALLVYGVTAIV